MLGIFRKFVMTDDHHEFIMSLEEVYTDICQKRGLRAAKRWVWKQLLKSLPKFIGALVSHSLERARHCVRISIRNIWRRKGYSSVKIFGLALGMAACILIFLWVRDEMGINQFHEHIDRLYRVDIEIGKSGDTRTSPVTSGPAVFELKKTIPEIEDAARLFRVKSVLLKRENISSYESKVYAADPALFNLFSFPLKIGDPAKALLAPNAVVISERIAEKYFGKKKALGQTLSVNNKDDFVVSGVFCDIPANSTIRFDVLFSFSYMSAVWKNVDSQWGNISFPTYVLLKPGVKKHTVDQKIRGMINRHLPDAEIIQFLVPFKEIYLYEHTSGGRQAAGMLNITIFSLVAVFILMIACVNFMNLSTARAVERAKEIGIRKISGAMKTGLLLQFVTEAFLMAGISLVFALLMIQGVMPYFNEITGKSLSLMLLVSPEVMLGLFVLLAVTSLAAGFYPAFVISSFKPANILKGWTNGSRRGSKLRKSLVIFQFALSAVLLICTAAVYKQIHFIKNKNLGWSKDQLLAIPLRGDNYKNLDALRNELISGPLIRGVSASRYTPLYVGSNSSKVDWDGKNPEGRYNFAVNSVGYDFFSTLQIEMLEGRVFSRDITTDAETAFIINEEARKQMGVDSAVGKRFSLWGQEGTIIGVSKNYHFQSVRRQIEPLVHVMTGNRLSYLLIRLQAGHIKEALAKLDTSWDRIIPGYPLEFTFLDEAFQNIYTGEKQVGQLLGYFSFMAVCIACLGLFSLASYTAQTRSKEIGIRKVLGSSVIRISRTFCWEFLLLVGAANAIAWPVAYYLIRSWLGHYAYRISVPVGLFVLFGLATTMIALASVAYQSITAARKNPVDAIRNH